MHGQRPFGRHGRRTVGEAPAHEPYHGAHQLGRVEVRDRILLRASLEAREVEQFRHESLQAHRLVRNHAVRLLAVFLGREATLAQHVRIRDDRRERRVELVRDERHEVRLRKGIQPRLVRGMVKQPHDGDDKKQRDAQEAVARQANDHGVVKRQILRIVEREHFRLADEDAEHLNRLVGVSLQALPGHQMSVKFLQGARMRRLPLFLPRIVGRELRGKVWRDFEGTHKPLPLHPDERALRVGFVRKRLAQDMLALGDGFLAHLPLHVVHERLPAVVAQVLERLPVRLGLVRAHHLIRLDLPCALQQPQARRRKRERNRGADDGSNFQVSVHGFIIPQSSDWRPCQNSKDVRCGHISVIHRCVLRL